MLMSVQYLLTFERKNVTPIWAQRWENTTDGAKGVIIKKVFLKQSGFLFKLYY